MALHAVESLACLCEDELVDAILAASASEAFGVEGVVACHDSLVQNRPPADLTVVAVCADRRAIGEKQKVGVGLRWIVE